MDVITTSQQTLPITTTSASVSATVTTDFNIPSAATIGGKHFHDKVIYQQGVVLYRTSESGV